MILRVLDGIEGAKQATGITLVIDVFRAFSTICYVAAKDPHEIRPVATVEEALALKAENPSWIVIGEVGAQKVEGFDFGNSPAEVEHADFKGKTVVHRTSAGVQGLTSAAQAGRIFAVSFLNADATVAHVLELRPETVSIVPMGESGIEPNPEDDLCAEYLRRLLRREEPPVRTDAELQKRLRHVWTADKFFNPACPWAPERDFELCTRLRSHPVVLEAVQGGDGLRLVPLKG
jgi:2-phosphosulfolactate phosphatase